jgi:protein involved in polysaccharide export with SLBB domain
MIGTRSLADSALRPGTRNRVPVLQPGDEVSLSIYDKLPVSQDKRIEMKRVDDDGTVFIIPAGKIQVGGLTCAEAEKAVEAALAAFVVSPFCEVTIIKQVYEPKVYVFGEVVGNGVHPLKEGDRLLDVISASGGVTQNAYRRRIHIVRVEGANVVLLSVDLYAILSGTRLEGNIAIRDQDIVFVPRHFLTNLREVSSVVGQLLPWYYYVRNFTF